MTQIEIKKIGLEHLTQLQDIGRRTFSETFSDTNTENNMKKYLEEGFSEHKLTQELSNEHSAFYFAQHSDEVIGYLKINLRSSQTERQDPNGLEIERIYVLAAYHGLKVGQLLYETALKLAKENKDVTFIWLGVWEKNDRALRFYQKNGFSEFDRHIFKLGDEEQTDIMMKKIL